jgi:hypothetical protein
MCLIDIDQYRNCVVTGLRETKQKRQNICNRESNHRRIHEQQELKKQKRIPSKSTPHWTGSFEHFGSELKRISSRQRS